MDTRKFKIDNTTTTFVHKIKLKFKPATIILFGSRATGNAKEYSDYDFIIISDAFKNTHWLERISQIVPFWDSDRSIDILPYTKQEFNRKKKQSSVVQQAILTGVEI